MKLIVGLGNPGNKYRDTRHNIGFAFIEVFAKSIKIDTDQTDVVFSPNAKLKSDVVETITKGEKLVLAEPQTFMNLSGESVSSLIDYYKAKPTDLIVIADDIDVPVGVTKIRLSGSSAGHKGIQSIIDHTETDQFVRIRIGVGRPDNQTGEPGIDVSDYVLSAISTKEQELLTDIIKELVALLSSHVGIDAKPIEAVSIRSKFLDKNS
jgi:PTH1 family peptidyl-tRNA hydrolase